MLLGAISGSSWVKWGIAAVVLVRKDLAPDRGISAPLTEFGRLPLKDDVELPRGRPSQWISLLPLREAPTRESSTPTG
jgi:hypothetical protein